MTVDMSCRSHGHAFFHLLRNRQFSDSAAWDEFWNWDFCSPSSKCLLFHVVGQIRWPMLFFRYIVPLLWNSISKLDVGAAEPMILWRMDGAKTEHSVAAVNECGGSFQNEYSWQRLETRCQGADWNTDSQQRRHQRHRKKSRYFEEYSDFRVEKKLLPKWILTSHPMREIWKLK